MKINLFLEVDQEFAFESLVKEIARLFENDSELSLIIIDDSKMRNLNYRYRALDRATDVLSFPDTEDGYLGDIFISLDKVNEQAVEYKHSKEEEFAKLLIHGILHLLGYDHIEDKDYEIMAKKEEEYLSKLFK